MKKYILLIMILCTSFVYTQVFEVKSDSIVVKSCTFFYTRIIFQKEGSIVGEKFFTSNAEIADQVAYKMAACQKSQHSDYSGIWILSLNYKMLKNCGISEEEVLYAVIDKADKERIEKNRPTYLYKCKINLNPYYSVEYFFDQPKRTLQQMGQYALNVTLKDACLKLY